MEERPVGVTGLFLVLVPLSRCGAMEGVHTQKKKGGRVKTKRMRYGCKVGNAGNDKRALGCVSQLPLAASGRFL